MAWPSTWNDEEIKDDWIILKWPPLLLVVMKILFTCATATNVILQIKKKNLVRYIWRKYRLLVSHTFWRIQYTIISWSMTRELFLLICFISVSRLIINNVRYISNKLLAEGADTFANDLKDHGRYRRFQEWTSYFEVNTSNTDASCQPFVAPRQKPLPFVS